MKALTIYKRRISSNIKMLYVERNQEMINASDYCIFRYNPDYQPPRRKYSKIGDYQSKSGSALAYGYASQRKRGGKDLSIINLC